MNLTDAENKEYELNRCRKQSMNLTDAENRL